MEVEVSVTTYQLGFVTAESITLLAFEIWVCNVSECWYLWAVIDMLFVVSAYVLLRREMSIVFVLEDKRLSCIVFETCSCSYLGICARHICIRRRRHYYSAWLVRCCTTRGWYFGFTRQLVRRSGHVSPVTLRGGRHDPFNSGVRWMRRMFTCEVIL